MTDYYALFYDCFPALRVGEEEFERNFASSVHFEERDEKGLAGFACINDDTAELLCVRADARGKGIGSRLLVRMENQARDSGFGTLKVGFGPYGFYRGVPETGEAPAFFAGRGYTGWDSGDMTMALADFSVGKFLPPDGVVLRFAHEEDMVPLQDAVRRVSGGWVRYFTNPATTLLAVEDGAIVGFLSVTPDNMPYFSDPSCRAGQIGCVGVVPEKRRAGIGLALVAEATMHLKRQGMELGYLGWTGLFDWYGKLGYRKRMIFRTCEKAVPVTPPRLQQGDCIGICAPCWKGEKENYDRAKATLEGMGFRVRYAKNTFSESWEFAGSVEERAADFNDLIRDDEVKLVLFGGGEVGNQLLPYLDYAAASRHPKLYCSYSDGTTILNALAYRSGIVTYNGLTVGEFISPNEYDIRSFRARMMTDSREFEKSGDWKTICGGKASGTTVGGYLVNFAVMQNSDYFKPASGRKYILFLEDHEVFSSVAVVSKYFAHLEQSGLLAKAAGLIFGCYSAEDRPALDTILRRVGQRLGIPVVKTNDYGHGEHHAVMPIGVAATLDADAQTLVFGE